HDFAFPFSSDEAADLFAAWRTILADLERFPVSAAPTTDGPGSAGTPISRRP
ncbi:MAG: hypothetical protein H6Q33_5414, partial [Deltaproteobacteria bacterium]|nr:hypothetical protein [Deltaproteobacteria bacterium]